jgi:hypothetical protein
MLKKQWSKLTPIQHDSKPKLYQDKINQMMSDFTSLAGEKRYFAVEQKMIR